MKYIATHSLADTTASTAKPSWNELLQAAVGAVPEAVATAKRLTPTIERLTPVAENVNTYIPYITIGIWGLGAAVLIFALKR